MDIKEFAEKITQQFLDEDQPNVTVEKNFRDLETWDSLTGMAIITIIHDEYGVDIPVDDFLKLETVGELFDYVKAKTSS
jgi:acyl carrier protein